MCLWSSDARRQALEQSCGSCVSLPVELRPTTAALQYCDVILVLFIVVLWVLSSIYLFYLLCHIYPGVPHQCAALFSLGLLHILQTAHSGLQSCPSLGLNVESTTSYTFRGHSTVT